MENINLKLESINGNEIIIREGNALPPVEPRQVIVIGDIQTISSFLGKRKSATALAGQQEINSDRALVVVDREARTIVLHLDPESKYGTVVTAKLELNPDLQKFSINANRTFKQKELCDLLKFSRLYFEDFDKHAMLLKAYQSFNAKAFIDMASDSDNRGNKSNTYNKKVETNLPVDFVLSLPIFKGMGKVSFHVEICLEVTDGGCNFWFESVELKELIDTEGESILEDQLESCQDYVIVYK